MRKKLNKIILSTCLIASSLMAESSFFDDTSSLIGVEGGLSNLDVERNDAVNPANIKKYNMGHAGLKIGAQSNDFRVFLSGRYYNADDFDYMTTYGLDIQYMLNITSAANIYFGAGTGLVKMRFAPAGELNSRTISDSYISGDIGVNVHLSKSFDLELGIRYMGIDATNTIDSVTYTFDNSVSGYVSAIYKFKMD